MPLQHSVIMCDFVKKTYTYYHLVGLWLSRVHFRLHLKHDRDCGVPLLLSSVNGKKKNLKDLDPLVIGKKKHWKSSHSYLWFIWFIWNYLSCALILLIFFFSFWGKITHSRLELFALQFQCLIFPLTAKDLFKRCWSSILRFSEASFLNIQY